MTRDYTIVKAPQDDAAVREICAFLQAEPSDFLRRLSEDDVRELTRQGRFYLARSNGDGALAGTIYVRSETPAHWEIGGAAVAAAHRASGLARALMVVAIVHPYLQERASSERVGRHHIEALVRPDNERMKRLVAQPEFCPLPERRLDPQPVRGIAHFPRDAAGLAPVLAYVFDEKYAPKYLRQALALRDAGRLDGVKKTVAIDVAGLRCEDGRDPLRELLEELGA
jgi:ribosomal protein S18 acetylase RimI-like enzyme